MTATKLCRGCGRELPPTTEFFRRNQKGRDGLDPRCKECRTFYLNHWRAAHPEKCAGHRAAYDAAHPGANHARCAAYDAAHRVERAAAAAAFRAANREHVAAQRGAFRARHAADIARYQAAWRAKHCAERAAYQAAYREAHRDQFSSYERNRKAPGHHTAADVARIRAAQGNRCFWCDEPLGRSYHVDHYVPIVRGGSNWPDNLVIACPDCNMKKGAKMPDDFLKTLEREWA